MSATILSGLTAVTTINLFEDYNIVDVIDDIKNAGCWLNNLLPNNRFVRFVIYTTGSVILLRSLPLLLRNTSFFTYFYHQIQYFHRSSEHNQIITMKKELLGELEDGKLPLFDSRLVILELNIGGGTNLSFYPEGTHLIATDYLEDSRDKLENNFLLTDRIILEKFVHTIPEELNCVPDESISSVVCFHSLCSARDLPRALREIKRVLLPGGKLYFIEHTKETQFSFYWVSQKNYSIQNMFTSNCYVGRKVEDAVEKAGFSDVHYNREMLDDSHFFGPFWAYVPHVYGYAKK